MPSRWFNIVVVLFWIATMTWLFATKVLPPLRIGEPPNYRAIFDRASGQIPVCWAIYSNNEVLGWAATRVVRREDGMMAMQGRVFLEQIPLEEMAPGWLGSVIKPLLRQSGSLALDARSSVDVDPLGRLVSFETRVQLARIQDAIRIAGQVDGTQLRILVKAGELVYKDDRYLPPGEFVGDELLPQAILPGLHVGQRWTVPSYSPFRPQKSPMEVLQAEVEREEAIVWNHHNVKALLVVYRADSGSGLAAHSEPRGKLWVRDDGLVMKQELLVFNSPLVFSLWGPKKCICWCKN